MQAFALAGATNMGAFSFNASLLDVITRRLRTGWRSLIDTLNQRGRP